MAIVMFIALSWAVVVLFSTGHWVLASLLVGGIRDGWSVYQPLNSQAGPGMIGYQTTIIVFAVSTALASVNIMTTILTMRAKGMTWARTPILVYGIFCAALMGLYAFPFYQYSQWLAMTDRVISTSFFDPQNGGSVWLYENLFWLLGHPEVYVILIPSMAVMMELIPVFMRKPLFSYYMAIAGIVGVVGLSLDVTDQRRQQALVAHLAHRLADGVQAKGVRAIVGRDALEFLRKDLGREFAPGDVNFFLRDVRVVQCAGPKAGP